MPNQPDTINMQQLYAQLDAAYSNTEQPATVQHQVIHYPEFHEPQFNNAQVNELTEQAMLHTPDHMALKAERIAMLGKYIESLRVHRMRVK